MNHFTGKSMIHIGNWVSNKMIGQHLSKPELVRRMDVNPTVVSQYLKQPVIHAALLWKEGQVMNYNFFAVLPAEHPLTAPTALEISLQQQLIDLQKELSMYKDIIESRRE